MELKEVILSTLAEMEEDSLQEPTETEAPKPGQSTPGGVSETASLPQGVPASPDEILEDERRYLESVKERLLVLFEGFQSPNNTHIEAKVDLTLNFLEYLLATIETRIEKIKKSER